MFQKKKTICSVRPLKIPTTVQESIPYVAVCPDPDQAGVIETKPGVYSRSYKLEDLNYQVSTDADQQDIMLRWSDTLNMFDPAIKFQIAKVNRTVLHSDMAKRVLLKDTGSTFDRYVPEYNKIITDQMQKGKNNLQAELYLTLSLKASSMADAVRQFGRLDSSVIANIKRIGSVATPQSATERLHLLYDFYNLGHEDDFASVLKLDDKKDVQAFDFDNLRRLGLTTKDVIGPSGMEVRSDYMMLGDTYCRTLVLTTLPAALNDNVVADLSDLGCNSFFSINVEALPQDKGLRMVRNKILDVNQNILESQKKATKSGYDLNIMPPDLQIAKEEVGEMLNDLTRRNQKLFQAVMTITVFAKSKQELDTITENVMEKGRRHLITIRKLYNQQDDGLAASLPLANNSLLVKRTLTTESLAIFMPFTTAEVLQPGGMYYGVNTVSGNLVLYNRRMTKNSNGCVFGTPGSGKSFACKNEIFNILLSSKDDEVLYIDPQSEMRPMAQYLNGEVVRIAVGGRDYINPFDLVLDAGIDEDPLAEKCSYLVGLITTMVSDSRYGTSPLEKAILDKAIRAAYKPYLESCVGKDEGDKSKLPTLSDVQAKLMDAYRTEGSSDAMSMAQTLEMYTNGSFALFNHHTNVDLHNRLVVFDIKDVGTQLLVPGMSIVMDFCQRRMVENRKRGVRTWIYIDEAHLLFRSDETAEMCKNLFKTARKYGGAPTIITQNVSDILANEIARTIIANTSDYVLLLSQSPEDSAILCDLLKISDTQKSYITHSDAGSGLLWTGATSVPFTNHFPRNTEMYRVMSTTMSDFSKEELEKIHEND